MKIEALCENNGFCTDRCFSRQTCRKQRVKFLTDAVVIDYSKKKITPDEYINELAIIKQGLVDEARHLGGKRLEYSNLTDINITAV